MSRQLYISDEDYLYDSLKDNEMFDENAYKASGFDYLATLEMGKDIDLDKTTYYELPSDQKMNYLAYSLGFIDDPNINAEYFSAVANDYQKQLAWDKKNWFEKLTSSISSTIKNVATEIYGTIESIVDSVLQVGATIGETLNLDTKQIKDIIAGDLTGVGKLRESMQEELRYNKWLNQGFGKMLNDSITSLGSSAVLALNFAVPGLGSILYYSNVFGKSVEETYKTRGTDVSAWEINTYAGLNTAAEWAGEQIFDSAFMKGMIDLSPIKSRSVFLAKAISFLEEGTEEVVTEILNYYTNSFYSSVVSSDYKSFLPENGLGRAILESFITGGLMGAISTGTGALFTQKITLPNGKQLSKYQSYLWKRGSLGADVSAVSNRSEIYNLKAKEGASYSLQEYSDAYHKDISTVESAIKALDALGVAEEVISKDAMTREGYFYDERNLRDAQNSIRNFWLEYSMKDKAAYKSLIEGTSKEYNEYAEKFNSTHTDTKLTVVNEQSDEFRLIENAFSGSGKKIIPVKVGSESGTVGNAFIEGSTVGQSGVVYVDVDMLGRMTPDQILTKAIGENMVTLLAKNNQIISDPAIREIFDRKSGKELTQTEKNSIAVQLLSNPKAIASVVGCNRTLAKKIIQNIQKRLGVEGGKTKYSKTTINQLNKVLLAYKLQLCINAGTKEGVVYYANEYNLDTAEMLELFNTLNEYDFQQHYMSERLDVSVESKSRTDALNFLNNARTVAEIQNENIVSDFSTLLDETIYKPEFVQRIKENSPYKNFGYALNAFLYQTYGIYINMNTGTFEVARNVLREIDPQFRLKMDSYGNRLYNLKHSKLTQEQYQAELNKIVDEMNNDNWSVSKFYNQQFIKHLGLKEDAPIRFEINDDVFYDATYNPAKNIITVYLNSFDYNPQTVSLKYLNSEVNDVRSSIYNAIIHESIHSLANSENSYYGTNIKSLIDFFNTAKGDIIYNKLAKQLESYVGSLDKTKMANLVYNLTYGEMEASRYSNSTPAWIRSFMTELGYSPEIGSGMVVDGFLATKDGKLIGKGAFRGIIITLKSTIAASEKRVSLDALSEEGYAKLSETIDNKVDTEAEITTRDEKIEQLRQAVKDYSSGKDKSRKKYIEIGRLSDELNIDLPGYNYDVYDRLVAEQQRAEKKESERVIEEKEALTEEEKDDKLNIRIKAIRETAKQKDAELLTKLENRYKVNDKQKLIEELGEERYKKLIEEFDKVTEISSKTALNHRARDIKNAIEKHKDKLTPENLKKFEELTKDFGDRAKTKAMSLEEVSERLKALEKINYQWKNKPYLGEGADGFREIQIASKKDFDSKSWDTRSKQLDEELRKRFSKAFKNELNSRGYSDSSNNGILNVEYDGQKHKIYENVDGQTFHDLFEIARIYTENGELVDLHDIEDYNKSKNYLSEDGTAGFAITSDGDLISVFNLKSSIKKGWLRMISPIIKENVKTLDCYMSSKQNLSEMYSKIFGFKVASIMEWNQEYDHDNIGKNHNKPSVAFMVNTESDVVTRYFDKNDWDGAHEYQQKIANKKSIDSKTIPHIQNKDGTPITLYKGTSRQGMTEFDNTKSDKIRTIPGAIWLTDSEAVAGTYTQSNEGAIYSVQVTANNPLIVDAEGRTFEKAIEGKSTDQVVREAKENGYDSVIIENVVDPGSRYWGDTKEARKPHTDIVVFDKNNVNIISERQASLEAKIEEKLAEKSETRAISKKIDEQVVVDKKAVSHEISEIITELSDTTYRTSDRYAGDRRIGEKTSLTKMGERKQYTIASQSMYFEKNDAALSAINKNNVQEIINELKTDKMDVLNKDFVLDYLWLNRYKFTKEQNAQINELISQKNTRIGQEMVAIKNALEESTPFKALASDIKQDYGVEIKVNDELAGKHDINLKELGWNGYLNKVTKEIDDLKKELKKTTDALKKYELEEDIKDRQKLANILAEKDAVGLMSYAYDKFLNPNYDYTEGAIKASELSNDILETMIEQTEGLSKLLKPKKDGKPGSMFSPATQQKILSLVNKSRSFRYLCMLSSFSTAARNAMTNTSIAMSKIFEDLAGRGIQKIVMKDAPESQVTYYGDYDKAFSDFIDDTYGEYVKSRSGTNTKWKETAGGQVKQEFKEKTDKFAFAPLNWWAGLERKMLSDAPWTTRRTLKNFKSMISGAMPQLKSDILGKLFAMYNVNTQEALTSKLSKSSKENYDLFVKMSNNDLIATTKLAMKLKMPLLEMILRKAEYRADRMYFRTDNAISRGLDKLRESHPIVHDIVTFFTPFTKVMYNTTMYAVEHSPIGLAQAVVKHLQTRNVWINDMRREITLYAQSLYYTETNKDNYGSEEFTNWVSKNLSEEFQNALNGYNKGVKELYNRLVDEGKIMSGTIGLDNPFAKADVVELYSKGAVGTSYLILGLVLALTGALGIDDDDNMGLVVRIGNVKIRLSDLAPFSTAFSFGAALIGASEGKFGTGLKNALTTFYDQTMLGTVESLFGYNDSITDIFKYQGIQVIQQYIPSIMKQFAKVLDPVKKKKSGNYWDKLWMTTASNIPGLSYLVPNKIDPYTGYPEKRFATGSIGEIIHMFNPLQTIIETKSDAEKEAERVGATTTGTTGKFSINGTDYKLTGKEYETYSRIRAEYVNAQITELMNSSRYNRMSDAEKSKEIKKIYDNATEIMKINYWLNKGHSGYVFTDYSKMSDYSNYIESSKIQYRKKWSGSKYIN